MTKQLIHAYIDEEKYIELKLMKPKINMSGTINELIGTFLLTKTTTPKEEETLLKEINTLTEELKEIQQTINMKGSQLVHIKTERKNQEELTLREAINMKDALQNVSAHDIQD